MGWNVTFEVNRPVVFGRSFGFSDDRIKKSPTTVNIFNPDSYTFVAELIGLSQDWTSVRQQIQFSWFPLTGIKTYDAVIGTQKDIGKLSEIAVRGIPTFALGYQHLPVIATLNVPTVFKNNHLDTQSIFFSNNPFAEQHKFSDILKNCNVQLNSFTYLDVVYLRKPKLVQQKNQVLIFYPGGYRGMITEPGQDKSTCYKIQKGFLERICLPLLRRSITPVLKVHPLRARHHDVVDLQILCNQIEHENHFNENSIRIMNPLEWVWETVSESIFVLNFGSTGIYEFWTAGITNVYICGFEGKSRSRKYEIFDCCVLKTYKEYERLLEYSGAKSPDFDDLTNSVVGAYQELFDGKATNKAIQHICLELGIKQPEIQFSFNRNSKA
jgi:hypothetical protein